MKICIIVNSTSGAVQAVTYIPPPPPETEKDIFEIGSNQGINFEKYQQIPVQLTGRDAPKPIKNFDEANLHPVSFFNFF